jgi:hypothetical protein
MNELKELQRELRELKREMKAAGIRRSSFMNGGHTPASYRANCECFRLETMIGKLKQSPVTA